MNTTETGRASGWRTAGAILVCLLAVLLAYPRVWDADFNWDDDDHITANPVIVGPQGLKEIWSSASANYFPLTMTSFWVQHELWGLRPGLFHGVTMLFHAASAALLWVVLRQLRVPGALLGALLWALHPVQVESAAWICELKNTQSACFYLLAVFWAVRWMQRAGPLYFGIEYALALLAAVAAVLSKASTVMLPVVLGLLGWWTGRTRWRDAAWLAPFLVVSLAVSGWTIWEQKMHSLATGAEWDHGVVARLLIAAKVPWFYLGKLLWPFPLVFIYPRWEPTASDVAGWVALGAGLAAVGLLWRHRNGPGRAPLVAAGYFVASLFPVLGFFDVYFFRYSFVGDHLQYLASMGPLALLGAAVATGAKRVAWLRPAGVRGALAGAGVAALGAMTWHQTAIYHSRETLWRDTVAKNPATWIARLNWGAELLVAGQAERAIEQFHIARRLRPGDALSETNLGLALLALKRPEEAVTHLETAVQREPTLLKAHEALGQALTAAERWPEAITAFRRALGLRPHLDRAWHGLIDVFARTGRTAELLPMLEEASREPGAPPYHALLARTLAKLGRTDEAIERYRDALAANRRDFASALTLTELLVKTGSAREAVRTGVTALQLRADSADAHHWLGRALLQADGAEQALARFDEALRLRPEFGAAHAQRAEALRRLNRLPEAVAAFRHAVQREPENWETRCQLAVTLHAAGQTGAALAECAAILRLRPDHAQAKQLQEQFQMAVGR